MAILHIQTESIRASGQQLAQAADDIYAQTQSLDRSLAMLVGSWQGISGAQFQQEMAHALYRLRRLADEASELSMQLRREADKWEIVDLFRAAYR